VTESVDADGTSRLLILPNGQPEIAHATLQQRPTTNESEYRRAKQNVVEHHRMTAQIPHVVVGVLRDRQKKTGRCSGPSQVFETDTGKFGKNNCQDGEIDASDTKTEGEEDDERRGGG